MPTVPRSGLLLRLQPHIHLWYHRTAFQTVLPESPCGPCPTHSLKHHSLNASVTPEYLRVNVKYGTHGPPWPDHTCPVSLLAPPSAGYPPAQVQGTEGQPHLKDPLEQPQAPRSPGGANWEQPVSLEFGRMASLWIHLLLRCLGHDISLVAVYPSSELTLYPVCHCLGGVEEGGHTCDCRAPRGHLPNQEAGCPRSSLPDLQTWKLLS